jgi:hypothetical protein
MGFSEAKVLSGSLAGTWVGYERRVVKERYRELSKKK